MSEKNTSPLSGQRATKIGGAILLSLAVIPLILDLGAFSDNANAQGVATLEWVGYDEGVRISNETGKKLLVDVYTDWCTWCKKMDADVYTTEDVRAQISKHFVPVKLNAESPESIRYKGSDMSKIQFSRAIGVTGYPSTLFLNNGEEPITLVPGFIPAERFAVILQYIGEDHYKSVPFESYVSQQQSIN